MYVQDIKTSGYGSNVPLWANLCFISWPSRRGTNTQTFCMFCSSDSIDRLLITLETIELSSLHVTGNTELCNRWRGTCPCFMLWYLYTPGDVEHNSKVTPKAVLSPLWQTWNLFICDLQLALKTHLSDYALSRLIKSAQPLGRSDYFVLAYYAMYKLN